MGEIYIEKDFLRLCYDFIRKIGGEPSDKWIPGPSVWSHSICSFSKNEILYKITIHGKHRKGSYLTSGLKICRIDTDDKIYVRDDRKNELNDYSFWISVNDKLPYQQIEKIDELEDILLEKFNSL